MFDLENSEELKIGEELYAHAIGTMVLRYLKEENLLNTSAQKAESDALRILSEIQHILNDDSLADPECIEKIDQIIEIFYTNGIHTPRHDWD